ncbi:MAG: hypothetical protein RL660_1590 [Bacteroidota bacterium]|jgi:dinuclear metal center YbgI/SA1388 family protein
MPSVKDIASFLDSIYPLAYQESYDNCGLLVGEASTEVSGILLSLDCTEAVLEEAITRNCNFVLCHHPIIFSGLKRLTGKNYVERTVLKAIKSGIAVYAAHTNVDNLRHGVSARMAKKLGLSNVQVLDPKSHILQKLYTYAPLAEVENVKQTLFAAGAGHIGEYSECSFSVSGSGTFKPSLNANPALGMAGGPRENVDECKIEVIYPKYLSTSILQSLHSMTFYEEIAYEIVDVSNTNKEVGSGVIGTLPAAIATTDFLELVASTFKAKAVRHTADLGKPIQKVALCGGSGSFLLNKAIAAGADAYISADFKYHEFFDADGRILIADIGHYESEQYTSEIFLEALQEKFPNFAVLLTEGNSNPINYFTK